MVNKSAIIIISLVAFVLSTHSAKAWDYNEEKWPNTCKEGTNQSPIALSRENSQEEEFSSLLFEQYDQTYPVQTKNNGHSFEIRLHVQSQPTVKGGGLPFVYILDHLHFHWQSEHVIEDVRFPLELHLVHYANIYGNLSEALKHSGGVAVFSVLFYLSPDDDKIFEPLITVIDKIKDQVNTIQQMQVIVKDFLPRDTAGFYRYNGSLTTPDCTEGVIWTIFTNKLPISREQVKEFPLLETEGHQLKKNYRSLQKLNGRKVSLRSSPIDNSSGNCLAVSSVLIVSLLVKEIMKFV